ncbi:MAG: translocation/assembly module TamB domain-containing protein [Thermodesulfobacteriota bacterium]|nr:translocation/assembly module TamB domain-containing protein [Thermodesulfobacteriota bacterium]
MKYSARDERRMMMPHKRFKILLLVAAPLIAAVCCLFALMLSLNSNAARQWAEEQINSRIAGAVTIRDHHISLFSVSADLRGVTLAASDGTELLSAEHIRLNAALTPLLHRTLTIRRISLEPVSGALIRSRQGHLNLISAVSHSAGKISPPPSGAPPRPSVWAFLMPDRVVVDSARINDLRITYDSGGAPVTVRADALRIAGRTDMSFRSGRLSFDGEALRLTREEQEVVLDSISLNAALKNGRVSPLALTLKGPAGRLQAEGQIRHILKTPELAINVTGSTDMAILNSLLPPGWGLSGNASLTAGIFGPLDDPAINASLTMETPAAGMIAADRVSCDLQASSQKVKGTIAIQHFKHPVMEKSIPLQIDFQGLYRDNTLSFTTFSARGAGAAITANAACDIPANRLEATMDLNINEISAVSALFGLDRPAGRLTMKATAAGNLPDIRAHATFTAPDLTWTPATIGEVSGDLQYNDGLLRINRLQIAKGGSRFSANGSIRLQDTETGRFTPDPALDLAISQSRIHLADVIQGRRGRIDLSGTVSGTIRNPAGKFSVHAEDVDAEIIRPATIDLTSVLSGDALQISSLTAGFENGQTVSGSGRLSMDRRYRFHLSSEAMALHLLTPVKNYGKVDGTARFSVNGSGTLTTPLPDLDGSIRIDPLTLTTPSMDRAAARIDLSGHRADVTLSTGLGLDATGSVDLAKQTFSAASSFTEADMAPLFTLAGKTGVSGTMTGRISAAGPLADPSALTASADFKQIVLTGPDYRLIQTSPFGLTYDNGTLKIPDLQLTVAGNGTMSISGQVGIDKRLDLIVNGSAPLSLAGLFLENLRDLTGTIKLDARVAGSIDQPAVTGEFSVADAGIRIPWIVQDVHGVSGTVRLTPDSLTITGIEGRVGSGKFTLSGSASLQDYQPVGINVTMNARSIHLSVPDTMDATLNADLNFAKNGGNAGVNGTVVLLDGVYYRDVNLIGYAEIIRAPFRKKRTLAAPEKRNLPDFLSGMALDVNLNHRLPFKVDNNIALLSVQPDIAIKGTFGNPILWGRASVSSGELYYQRKTFAIEQGVISFTDPYKTSPHIDITGTTKVRQWTIRLNAAGTPDRLALELTSDPPESEGDILSLLLLGRTTKELNAAGGTGKTPSQMLAEILAAGLSEDIKHATGLDIVEISPDTDTSGGNVNGVKVTVGTKLSDRLTLKHSVISRQGEMVQEAASDYQLTENTTLSGFQDNRGIFGGKIVYRLEFR